MTDVLWAVFLDVLIPLFGTVAAAALTGLIVRLLQRYNVVLDAEQTAKLEKFIQDIIVRVEELARQKRLAGVTMTSDMKKLKAVALATDAGLSREDAIALIEQELPKVRQALGQK